MKTLFIISMISLAAIGGLMSIYLAGPQKDQDVFHVTGVEVCADADLHGTFRGEQYGLSAQRGPEHLGVACYDPVRPEDVGKDYKATLANGELLIDVPGAGAVKYSVVSVSEK